MELSAWQQRKQLRARRAPGRDPYDSLSPVRYADALGEVTATRNTYLHYLEKEPGEPFCIALIVFSHDDFRVDIVEASGRVTFRHLLKSYTWRACDDAMHYHMTEGLKNALQEELGSKDDLDHRVVTRLRTQAPKILEALVKYDTITLSMERLVDKADFQITIDRALMMKWTERAIAEMEKVVDEALENADGILDRIHIVEAIGEFTRIPTVEDIFKEKFGKPVLRNFYLQGRTIIKVSPYSSDYKRFSRENRWKHASPVNGYRKPIHPDEAALEDYGRISLGYETTIQAADALYDALRYSIDTAREEAELEALRNPKRRANGEEQPTQDKPEEQTEAQGEESGEAFRPVAVAMSNPFAPGAIAPSTLFQTMKGSTEGDVFKTREDGTWGGVLRPVAGKPKRRDGFFDEMEKRRQQRAEERRLYGGPPPRLVPPLAMGSDRIGRFSRVVGIRRSYFSDIAKGRDTITGREVILKRALRSGNYPQKMKIEIERMKMVQGPGIVEVLDVIEEDGMEYLILEKMDCDMHDLLKTTYCPNEADRKAWMKMALTGLKRLHDINMLHADIKPENFFYSYRKGLKLGDFGNAMMVGDPISCDRVNYCTFYRCQALFSDSSKINKHSDIWAMGMLHQDLIKGRPHWLRPEIEYRQIDNIKTRLIAEKLDLDEDFANLGQLERDFLDGLVKSEPESRVTVDEALAHPWFTSEPLPTSLENLPKYIETGQNANSKKRGRHM